MKIKTNLIFNCFLLFLPFTQALTLNLFFPLKISELILFLLIFIFIQIKFNTYFKDILNNVRVLIVFLILVSFSFLINAFWKYEYSLKEVPFRIGPISDSLLRLIYIYLNVFAFVISIYFVGKYRKSLNFWLLGACLASIYSWYIFLSSAFGIPYIKLFGMEEIPQNISGIVRSGTFKEGNFFSLFLVLSASISFYFKRIKTAWFFILTILTTLSTIGLISGLVFIIIFFKDKIFKKRNLKIVTLLSPIIILGAILFFQSQFYENYVYKKLFTPIENLTPSNLSKVDRYLTGEIAYKQGINNPYVGVGPNNFSLHYDYYNDFENIISNNTEWSLEYFKRYGKKAIPNNVYLEVWAEYGIPGFLLFVFFLAYTFWTAIRLNNLALIGGLLAMFLSLNAFPSFIMLFIWVYMAIPYALLYNKKLTQKTIDYI